MSSRVFWRDGVLMLKHALPRAAVASLSSLADRVEGAGRSLIATNGEALSDSYLWITEKECGPLLGTLANLASTALGAGTVRLFYDQLFTKEAGHSMPTKWHQDLPHWPLAGSQICTIWLAVDPVTRDGGALRYLVGSHRWGKHFAPWPEVEGDAPPDFEAPEYRQLERSYDLEPGDCVIHHGLTVHASHANAITRTRRVAYVTRWLGDDVRYRSRSFSYPFPMAVDLAEGQALDHPLFMEFPRDSIDTA